MPTYCIICGKQKTGIPVENDYVLDMLKWFKRNVTKNEQKNRLVVCKEDYAAYKKSRDRYIFRTALYLTIGGLFLILGLVISFSLATFLTGAGLLIFLYLLSLLNYTPKLRLEEQNAQSKKSQ